MHGHVVTVCSVSCGSAIAKDCFVHNHFDWCIRHQYMANDDLEDRDGEPCQHEDAGEGFDCTIVHCGKFHHRTSWRRSREEVVLMIQQITCQTSGKKRSTLSGSTTRWLEVRPEGLRATVLAKEYTLRLILRRKGIRSIGQHESVSRLDILRQRAGQTGCAGGQCDDADMHAEIGICARSHP